MCEGLSTKPFSESSALCNCVFSVAASASLQVGRLSGNLDKSGKLTDGREVSGETVPCLLGHFEHPVNEC